MREKIVLVGAGSAVFTRGMLIDLIKRNREYDLALVDTDPVAAEVVERLARKMVEARKAPISLSGATDIREVLPGATAVICTIGVGGRSAWEQDVFIPRKHGIYQPVGDTIMPGGTSRAMRMIPAMVEIAEAVLDIAPEALFFNYGNPMSAVCRGVRKATGANVVGLCHGVHMIANYLAGALGVDTSRLTYDAVGINHLTWFTRVRVEGQDAMPRLRQIADERLAQAECGDRFSWELMRLVGAFPAVVDRHITEFFPQFFRTGDYYGKRLGVDAFSFENTIAHGNAIWDQMREMAFSDQPLGEKFLGGFSGEHEQVVEIIDSIRSDARKVYSANLPNRGQVPNLPPEAVVECPAIADGSGLRPIQMAPLDSGLAATLARPFAWVETVVDAALECSREKFVQALMIDGSVSSLDVAAQLADELIAAHREYLPGFGL